jgi:hypothetical protein
MMLIKTSKELFIFNLKNLNSRELYQESSNAVSCFHPMVYKHDFKIKQVILINS